MKYLLLILLLSCGHKDEHTDTVEVSPIATPVKKVRCVRHKIVSVTRCYFKYHMHWCYYFKGVAHQWVVDRHFLRGTYWYAYPGCYSPRRGHIGDNVI